MASDDDRPKRACRTKNYSRLGDFGDGQASDDEVVAMLGSSDSEVSDCGCVGEGR